MTTVRCAAAGLAGTVMAIACASDISPAAAAAREFMVVNAKTGKCLTIAGGTSSDNNVVAVQFRCDGDPSRRWTITPKNFKDTFQITNVKTGKCLTIAGGVSKDNNVRALQFDCDDNPSRTWRISGVSGGSRQIMNVQTGKCLTIAGGTLADDNIEAVQFDCDEDTSRRWMINAASAASPSPQPQTSSGAPAAPAIRMTDWSQWLRGDGVKYRYRSRWNPQDSKQLDAIFQVQNLQNRAWHGSVRSADCIQKTLSADAKVNLNPGETREVSFRTRNCGTATSPSFIPGVAEDKIL
jgi:cytolethal distending toxin subunit A